MYRRRLFNKKLDNQSRFGNMPGVQRTTSKVPKGVVTSMNERCSMCGGDHLVKTDPQDGRLCTECRTFRMLHPVFWEKVREISEHSFRRGMERGISD